jgi:hypothetical protein
MNTSDTLMKEGASLEVKFVPHLENAVGTKTQQNGARSTMKKELDVGPLQGEQMEQQYAPQPQQYAPQPVAPQQVNVNMMQPRPQAPIIINNNNNDNNINTMQMQAPTPQQMYTQAPSTGWQSGLFECFNDFPVCASRPAAAHSKQLAPALGPSTPKGLRCMSLPPHVV